MEKTFVMQKDDSATLPNEVRSVVVGLGWECPGSIDLDASIIGLNSNKEVNFTVYYSNKNAPGVSHAGDNTTGDGDGDDEQIRIDLDKVAGNVAELFITVNIYSNGKTFGDVHDAYVRLCSVAKGGSFYQAGHTLAKYPLDGQLKTRGMVFARLTRHGQSWSFDALAWGCGGNSAINSETRDVVCGKRAPIPLLK
jgi:tellurium resistance protein TerD